MRNEREILQRFQKTECEITEQVLAWVLSDSDTECPMCEHTNRKRWERDIQNNVVKPSHLETNNNWAYGTVQDHMDNHILYDHNEALVIDTARSESINTLSIAETVAQELLVWLSDIRIRKEEEGITDEVVTSAMKIVAQLNTSVKLIGQLKQEIGVDSQLLLQQRRMDNIMGLIVDVFSDEPELLSKFELRLAASREPTKVIDIDDGDWDV